MAKVKTKQKAKAKQVSAPAKKSGTKVASTKKPTPKAAKPVVKSKPVAKPTPKPAKKVAAKPVAKKTAPKAAAKPAPKPAPKAAKPTPKKPAPKPAAKPVAKPATKVVAKPTPKVAPAKVHAPASKAATAPAPKAAAPVPKPAAPAAKPAASAPKPVVAAAAPVAKPPVRPLPPANAPLRAALPKPPPNRPRGKPLSKDFLTDLAASIKEAVLPIAKELRGREIVSQSQGGDATFELDRVAEKALLNFLKNAKAPVAYYSEDAGYSTFTNESPKNLILVDPVDGTRAAKSGFEGCVVCIAGTTVIERPTMGDVDSALVMEILGDRTFHAERGKGARMWQGDQVKRFKLSPNTSLESLTWSMTVPARPAELIFQTAAKLIDLSSLKGGFFACNSTSFSLTRLVTGQMDAAIDVATRYIRDIPEVVRDRFINAGRGAILGIAPYDLAAGLLIAQEAGCVVTDAHGRGFDDVLLLDSSDGNHQSMIAASNAELHSKLLIYFDTRIKQVEAALEKRHAAKVTTG